MALWNRLYNTVWLAFFACVLIPRWMGRYVGSAAHVLCGVGILLLLLGNARRLAALPVPDRLKRISKTTAGLAVFQAICGVAFGAVKHMFPDLPVVGPALHGAHVVVALAMLAQAASVATGHDMWEEKEFGPAVAPTPPAEPPPPAP